jgi:SAM-dependent methyltransferase
MLQPHILRATLKAVSTLPNATQLNVLDLSCGDGELLQRLSEGGCRCRGSRFREDDYIRTSRQPLSAVEIDDDVDLLGRLPYADGQFDLVIMTEVLEHLASHHTVVNEVSRILKPGGHYLFTTPNIHRLHSRWQFFLTGTHKLIRRRVGWDLDRGDLYAYHINPVAFPLMHTLLFQAGLQVASLRCTKFKLRHALWLAAYPLIYLMSRLTIRGRRRDPVAFGVGERDLRYWMTHPAMLASEQLLVIAQRRRDVEARQVSSAA